MRREAKIATKGRVTIPRAIREALGVLGTLQVDGHHFVSELVCSGCGRREKALRLTRPVARCSRCNLRLASTGFGALERLESGFAGEFMDRTLTEIGLHPGDILSSGSRHRLLKEAA